METHQIRSQANMRRLIDSRAKDKAAERALREQLVPGTYHKFVPNVDTLLAVEFPGEVMRCPVKKVISPDSVLIHVDSVPMTKSHSFDFDKMYGARRRMRDGKDIWVAQKDKEFLEEQARILEAEEKPRVVRRTPAEIARKKGVG